MSKWKRVVIGDAFRAPSHDLNYYRDSFLLWPFLLFTIAALVNLFTVGKDHRLGFEFAALSALTILLARERVVLIGVALGFCTVQPFLVFAIKHDWVGLAVAVPAGTLFYLLIRSLKNYRLSYGSPKGGSIVDLLIGLLSLGLALAMLHWISR